MRGRFQPGDLIGEYRVDEAVADGYRAFHLIDARGVLIKVWPLESSAAISAKIARATRVLNALEHPGVAHFVECGVLPDRRRWTAIELPDGLSLHDAVARRVMRADEVASLVRDVAEVLAYAHERRMVHGNLGLHSIVLRDGDDPVSVADWGGMIDTAPDAPEPEGDARVDVHALGAVAYHALTGRQPGQSVINVPGAPPALAQLMIRMLSPDPAVRPLARDVHAALTQMLGGQVPFDSEITRDEDAEDAEDARSPLEIVIFKPTIRRPKWTPAGHLVTTPGIGDPVGVPPKRRDDL